MDRIFEKLPREIAKSLEALAKTDKLEERKIHSEIILNLSSSLGTLTEAMDITDTDFDADDDEFDFDDPLPPLGELKKKGKKPRSDEDIPF